MMPSSWKQRGKWTLTFSVSWATSTSCWKTIKKVRVEMCESFYLLLFPLRPKCVSPGHEESFNVRYCCFLFSILVILVKTTKTCWRRAIQIRHFVLVFKTFPLGSFTMQLNWISWAFNIVTKHFICVCFSITFFCSSLYFRSIICIPEVLQFTVGLLEGEFIHLYICLTHPMLNLHF